MTPYYSDEWLTVLEGDCREVMRGMEPESVHCVVTSPPYWGLRDYGTAGQLGLEPTPEAYVAALVDVFREVRRVLLADGTVWLNLGDSYAGSGMTGGTASKDGGAARVARMFHGNRRDTVPGLAQKQLVGIPWRVAFALQADGWYLRSDIIWAKPNPMPESVTDRPTKSHEYVFLLTKSARYWYDAAAVRERALPSSIARYAYADGETTRINKGGAYRDKWDEGDKYIGVPTVPDDPAGRNLRSVWTIATAPYPGAHFATFPPRLVEPCIKAGCPVGGTVLDPFAGTGTVGLVAAALSRRAVLIDLNAEYLRQCLDRNRQMPLGVA